jgi:hypothetical protein
MMQIYQQNIFFGFSLFFAIFGFFENFIKKVGQKLGNNISSGSNQNQETSAYRIGNTRECNILFNSANKKNHCCSFCTCDPLVRNASGSKKKMFYPYLLA